jgi:glucose/arabinose dehydrogenase
MPPFARPVHRSLAFFLSQTLLMTSMGLAPAPEAASLPDAPEGSNLPPGFTETGVASIGSETLTALAFTPDDRLLITTQDGQLRVYQSGALLPSPALDFTTQWPPTSRICSNFERGLLGVAVDPDFANNNFIYLYYTFNKNNACPASSVVNRVSRFILQADNAIVTTTETILIDNIPSTNGNHNAGDLHFGLDGWLYASAGDAGTGGSNARTLANLAGKILRVTRDGDIPVDNPYLNDVDSRRCGDPAGVPPGTGPCQEIVAFGLRNPFRFTFRPNSNEFYINDVGQNTWEEIDLGQIGADYGWNCREGAHTYINCNPLPPNMIDPIYEYNHNIGCNVITGGAFVPNGVWPSAYDDHYLFTDAGCGRIWRLDPITGGYTATQFATSANIPNHMIFGPYSNTVSLYYAGGNQVRRIDYVGSENRSPTAQLMASPVAGPAPLLVTFNATGSADADGDSLTFDWDFGDGAVLTGTTNLTTTHTYTTTSILTATLIVRDNQGGASAPATVEIQPGNTPPTPTIQSPLTSTLFAVGQTMTLTGNATDAEDGGLPDSALTWEVLIHHIDVMNPGNAHTHTYVPLTVGNNLTFTAPAPEDLSATAFSYVEIRLTAADSLNLTTAITQTLDPNRVNLTFNTNPANLQILIAAQPYTAPQTVVGWEAWGLAVEAQDQYDGSNRLWLFSNWSDGGAAAHTLTILASSATYTATFTLANLLYLPLISR